MSPYQTSIEVIMLNCIALQRIKIRFKIKKKNLQELIIFNIVIKKIHNGI